MYTIGSYTINFDSSLKDCIMATKKTAPQQTSIEIDGDLSDISDADLDALQRQLNAIRQNREDAKRRLIEQERSKDLTRINDLQTIIQQSLREIQNLAVKHEIDDIEVSIGDFSVTMEDGEWVSSYY